MVFTCFSSIKFCFSGDLFLWLGNCTSLWLLTAVWVLWLRGLSGEEKAHCSAIEKYFNYINGGWLIAFCPKKDCFYCSLKVNQKTWFDHAAKSFHFHPFMFINVATAIFILHVCTVLSEISCAISCCMPTGKLTTFKIHIRFVSKYFICLGVDSFDGNLWT